MKRGEKFEELMKRKGFNKKTLSEASGVAYSTLDSMIKRDFYNASIDSIIALAKTLEVEVAHFIPEAAVIDPAAGTGVFLVEATEHLKDDFSNVENKLNIYEETSRAHSMKEVDYYGQISAGERSSVFCESKGHQIELPKFIFGKYAERPDIFVLKTSGDSMNKTIPNNSYVICAPIKDRNELKNNDIVIYTYENESSMKRYYETDTHVVFSPESHNKNHFDFVVPKDTINNVEIDAKVIGYHVILE